MIKKILYPKFLIKLFTFVVILSLGIGIGLWHERSVQKQQPQASEKNTIKAFLSESYDKIKENYWDNISDMQLIDMFTIQSELLGKPLSTKTSNKDELIKALDGEIKTSDKANEFAVKLVSQVLVSLQPQGRSGLFTTKQEEQLKNAVSNINPEKDLYKDLGLSKGASQEEVDKAYQKQQEELKKDQSPQAQDKLKQITYAKDVLTKDETKQRYDAASVEPTIFTKLVRPSVLYVQFKKFSPTSLEEFQKAFDTYKDTSGLDSFIFDLRGNIGGAIDATSLFLGFFVGKNQYAFDFYHKGAYLPFKTTTEKLSTLSKYKQIVILVDNQTQSSAEMLAASFKKYHLGVVLGVPTKGWGTVERVFTLDNQTSSSEKYSIFLVHSITLREDNQPIEGRGVEPDIKITDTNWQQQLFSYFRNQNLIDAVKSII